MPESTKNNTLTLQGGLLTGACVNNPVEWLPSPNCSSRQGDEISLLVIHNISLPPGEFGGGYIKDFFTNCLNPELHPYFSEIEDVQVSTHLLIERDGRVTQFVSLLDKAWHAGDSSFQGRGNCNDFSIGIELEGTDSEPYTDNQYESLGEVVAFLRKNFPLISLDRIVGHCDIAPQRKTDPGQSFDWSKLFTFLEQDK